jgi:hypothetical protein
MEYNNNFLCITILLFFCGFSHAQTPDQDFGRVKDVFCDVSASLVNLRKSQEGPDRKPNPVLDAVIDQGGRAGVRMCNVLVNIEELLKYFNPALKGDKSFLALSRRLEQSSRCLETTKDEKMRRKCLADSMLAVYDILKPFFDATIGFIKDNKFHEGALFHMSHLEEWIPPSMPGYEKVKNAMDLFAGVREGYIQPIVWNTILPLLDMVRQLAVSMEAMNKDTMSAEARAALTTIEPIPLEIDNLEDAIKEGSIQFEDVGF